jgi:hypothetical protein
MLSESRSAMSVTMCCRLSESWKRRKKRKTSLLGLELSLEVGGRGEYPRSVCHER